MNHCREEWAIISRGWRYIMEGDWKLVFLLANGTKPSGGERRRRKKEKVLVAWNKEKEETLRTNKHTHTHTRHVVECGCTHSPTVCVCVLLFFLFLHVYLYLLFVVVLASYFFTTITIAYSKFRKIRSVLRGMTYAFIQRATKFWFTISPKPRKSGSGRWLKIW